MLNITCKLISQFIPHPHPLCRPSFVKTDIVVIGAVASEPVGVGVGVGVLELLLGEGLTSRHQLGSVPEQFPHGRKDRKGASKPTDLAECAEQGEPGKPRWGQKP